MTLDTIIIGGGAMGSSAAYWLSKYQDVAVIEQHDLLHHNGSSHGHSRVIRKTYRQPYFSKMMQSAYDLWNNVQQECETNVFTSVGGLDVGSQDNEDMDYTLKVCQDVGISHSVLSAEELQNRFPAYSVPDKYWAIYQPDTGILNATKAVNMFQQRAAHQGAQFITGQPVSNIISRDNYIIVETPTRSYRAKNVVITTGSWVNSILQKLGYTLDIEVWRLTFAYWKVLRPELFVADNFPVFIHWGENIDYGFPIHERENYIKIAPHINSLIDRVSTHPQENAPIEELLEHTTEFISTIFTGINPKPEFVETCLYTMTQDENFILDHLPNDDRIYVAAGFSGHGFKFTPLIGRIIQQETMNEDHNWDLSPFTLSSQLNS